jgi:mannose-6-phosphate isomerase-like protein (cupin superfamily)
MRSASPALVHQNAASHVDPAAIARRLGSVVHWPGAGEVRERTWRVVAQTSEYDAWVIAWPTGGTIDLHDHGDSRGALHVISGTLVETMPWRDDADRLRLVRLEVPAGVTRAFDAGHVHDVRNEGSVAALSVHVYSPPLTSMLYYDCFEDRVVPRERAWTDEGARAAHGVPPADQRALHLVAP